jgi:GT2 family glycosyltransferase
LEIAPNLVEIIRECSSGDRPPDYVYGNYYQRDERDRPVLTESNVCPDDITEREDWGALELYRIDALRRIGGCNPALRFRPDYDLRLRLTESRPACRLSQPLCTVPFRPSGEESASDALFYPGRGRFGGFSYLFLDPEEEREIEEIFYQALHRRGAFLEASSGVKFSLNTDSHPRVSVIIPVHNRARFLPLAVESVRRGSFSDFEIVIVDNASQDDTLKIAEQLSKDDPRVRVIALRDNIIARALNIGVRAAKGEYIAQLDSDDEYTPDTLAEMVKALDEHRDWALAISYYELMDESGKTLDDFGVVKHLEYSRNNILRVDGAGAVRCWRKRAIEEFGGFDEEDFGHYGEDYDLVLKVSEKYEVGRVHRVLYRYRRHPDNSDILRPHEMKIRNKTLARTKAIERRRRINMKREKL